MAGLEPGGDAPWCLGGCPSLRDFREGEILTSVDMQMLCESGGCKLLSLEPMIVALPGSGAPALIHMFDGGRVSAPAAEGSLGGLLGHGIDAGAPLPAARGTEVLRLVALGRGTHEIAAGLEISPHTVRNHVRHLRRRLEAKTKLDAVVAAIRLGILTDL